MLTYLVPMLWVIGVAVPIVALDAGHGGSQMGAIGPCGLVEKQLTLAIATDVAQLLRQHGQSQPLLLRKDDRELPLRERSTLANQAKAALLVSIHANASPSLERSGVEIYYLGTPQRSSLDYWQLVSRENEQEELLHITSMIPNHLLIQLAKTIRLQQSQLLAGLLQEELAMQRGHKGRGVLPGPFFLLANAAMPAVLVEIGFVSNPSECQQLATLPVQQAIAEAIAVAIVAYLGQQADVSQQAFSQVPAP